MMQLVLQYTGVGTLPNVLLCCYSAGTLCTWDCCHVYTW